MALHLEGCLGAATASEVAAWVAQYAHEEARRQESLVARVESVPLPRGTPELPPTPTAAWSKRSLAASLFVMLLVAVVFAARHGAAPAKASPQPVASGAPSSQEPPPLDVPAAFASAPSDPMRPSDTSPLPRLPCPPLRVPPPQPPQRKKTACATLFTIDADGHKLYKPECLR